MAADLHHAIAEAAGRIAPHILRTPLLRSRYLEEGGGQVYLKLENEQHTGSFKARGRPREALRHYDVELVFHGTDCLQTELYAKQLAQEQGMAWVSPYNDPQVIAGQGTVGKEILDDLPEVDAILATVGGGGLVSGIASWLKAERPQTECQPRDRSHRPKWQVDSIGDRTVQLLNL